MQSDHRVTFWNDDFTLAEIVFSEIWNEDVAKMCFHFGSSSAETTEKQE